MVDLKKFTAILSFLDNYMTSKGKKEINDMEANRELEHAGLLNDSQTEPGLPLRNLLMSMRDITICRRMSSRCMAPGQSSCLRQWQKYRL